MVQASFFSTNNIIYTVIAPSALFIIILCFTYTSHSGTDFLLTGSVINQVRKDINSAPITNLKLTKGQCPAGFETLTLGEWAGSVDGCSSIVGKPHTNCHMYNIERIAPLEIMNWKGSNFCAKRSRNYNYTAAQCQSGYRRCSKQLCVANSEECPLTGMMVGKNPEVQENSTVFRIDDVYYIQTFRTQNEDPLISVEFSYGEKPCLAQGYAIEDENAYPLLKQKYNCGKYGLDGRTKMIDQTTEINLYTTNGMGWIMERLEYYEDTIKNNNVSLVMRQRMELGSSPVCYKLQFPEVPTQVIEMIILNQNAWIILILVFEILLLMIAAIFGCMFATKKDTDAIFEFFSMFNLVTVSIIITISVLWISILYNSGRSGLEQLEGMKYQFTEIPGAICFNDPAVRQAFADINREIGTVPEALEVATSYILYIALLRCLLVFSSFLWRKYSI